MKPLSNIQFVYFIGIGGIGMSALAQYFLAEGKQVAGYDKTPGSMTEKLQEKGVSVDFGDDVDRIPTAFKAKLNTLVIYTPAVPADLAIFNYFREHGFLLKKRAEVLGDISREIPTLAIAGTHGKTTTSAILSHLLKQAGMKITAFIGGVSENYDSNFINDGKEACVVEADEFDRSFLKLSPQYAAITSMDADHLDIYENPEQLIASFHQFAKKLPDQNNLVFKQGLDLKGDAVAVNDEKAVYAVQNIRLENGAYRFDFKTPNTVISDLVFALPGRHNLLNAAIALALALKFGADKNALSFALKTFEGVKRRFSYHLRTPEKVLIEDYAHHPAELNAIGQAVREMYPDKKVTAVFQPHLYSRTRDFAEAFARSLEAFDQVILLPIYPAREQPIPGIDSAYLLGLVDLVNKKVIQKGELTAELKMTDNEIILMLGAGDIGLEVENVKKALSDEN